MNICVIGTGNVGLLIGAGLADFEPKQAQQAGFEYLGLGRGVAPARVAAS